MFTDKRSEWICGNATRSSRSVTKRSVSGRLANTAQTLLVPAWKNDACAHGADQTVLEKSSSTKVAGSMGDSRRVSSSTPSGTAPPLLEGELKHSNASPLASAFNST